MKHPEWALKHKRKGTELRLINGTYYLYEVTSRWNPEKGRAQKITGKLLGKVTKDGFVESPKYSLAKNTISSVVVKEYGASCFLQQLMDNLSSCCQRSFPENWQEIMIVSYLRLLYQSPIKNLGFYFQNSYLSVTYPHVTINDKKVAELLRITGQKREEIRQYLKMQFNQGHHLVIDATHLLTQSEGIEIAKVGYNSEREFVPQVNLLFIYSVKSRLPVYYRMVPGNIREIKAFSLTIRESGIEDAIIIADKGFYSEGNIEMLKNEGLNFIIPLRRSSTLIEYDPLKRRDKKGFEGYFKFHNRYIWYYSYRIRDNTIYCYLDETLRVKEDQDYLKRIETHPETYNLEEYHIKQLRFGTLSLLTNIHESTGEEIYKNYKSRNDIEVMIDAMKNILKADSSYMREQNALEGWMFTTFIALQLYYGIYKLLKEKDLLSRYSPKDLLLYLTEIKKVRINDTWHTAEIPNKTKKVLDILGLHIT